jgi:hypothetical protein
MLGEARHGKADRQKRQRSQLHRSSIEAVRSYLESRPGVVCPRFSSPILFGSKGEYNLPVRNSSSGLRSGFAAALAALALAGSPLIADDFDGAKLAAALAMKNIPPAPRLPDGRPDLGNDKGSWDPPGIGDMAGTHGGFAGTAQPDKVQDVPFLPWTRAAYDLHNSIATKDDPEGFCLPPGIPRMYATSFPFQIYQLSNRVLFVFEGGAHMWRVVYTDGRKHTTPDKLNPTYLGEGIGRWQGDTLVIDDIGFNTRSWLDAAGHEHTEQLHVVERFTRVNQLILHYEAAIDDPGAYAKTWTVGWNILFHPGMEPMEYICQENNVDMRHLVGK